MTGARDIGWLADRQDIANVLARHSRGVDRADAGLLASCYHDDAFVDYRFFTGAASEFVTILSEAQKAGPVTLHRTGQMWTETDGERAISESYVMAYASSAGAQGPATQHLICGRYLDRHEKRSGHWRLTQRNYVLDTSLNWDGGLPLPGVGSLGSQLPTGGHGAADAGIALLAQAYARNRTKGSKPMTHSEQAIDAVISRQQIADVTMAYCRGVDRADPHLLSEVFHEDASVVSGVFNGNGRDFASEICRLVESAYEQTFHSIANQWIEVEGDGAVGETYVIAVSTSRGDEKTDTLTGGRYVDRFERRDGRWAIADRTFVLDWARSEPSTRDMTGGMYAALDLHGCRGKDDPVYAFRSQRTD
ncbi:SnoaL-like protein [Novosphingobium sp. PhB57]|uniref:nuclear transport factor 2 family protein n=1 Tax=Novosphingobium sp. PhB57 TaxID=2485107 RepID=UPI00104453A0|nr:nuclear transport factor 2 family protein [Novosphingobium sp. PhB57]TCU57904.1 SnoaL-like protein [Novosphingobium sp. PhB57]